MSEQPDRSDWPTKREAAAQLSCSEKHIERLVSRGKLEQQWRRIPGKKPVAIYHPRDLAERLAEATPQEVTARVLPPTPDTAATTGAVAIRKRRSAGLAVASRLADDVDGLQALHLSMEICSRKLFLTESEAAWYSGLPLSELRALMQSDKLPYMVVSRGERRIRRRDLEAL